MNEPLREAIEDILDHYETDLMIAMGIGEIEMTTEQHDNTLEATQQAILQLFRTTLTDLKAAGPREQELVLHQTKFTDYQLGFNLAIKQQQAAFKKVLKGME